MKISYEYDASGNRTKKTVGGVETTYVYDPANRLTSETTDGNTITYGYDYRGNLTSKTEGSDVTAYEWDSRNRLTKVTFPDSSTESYTYDAQDRRVSKTNAGGTTRYVWDGENLLQERDETGAVQAHYTNAPGTWGGLTSQRRGNESHFYSFDSQGNTRFLTDASGNVTDTYEYSAYGEELSATGSTTNPFRYNGRWGYHRDAPNRYQVRRRVYEARMGRWLSRDPIGFDGGDWNLYRYVGNNPINDVDPSGQRSSAYVCEPNCPPEIIAVVKRLCHLLRRPTLPFYKKINTCIQKTLKIHGISPQYWNDNRSSCFRTFCRGDGKIQCLTKEEALTSFRTPGGHIQHNEPYPVHSIIQIVPTSFDVPGYGDLHDPSIPVREFVILHEMGHACGVTHGTENTAKQRNDVLACCLYNILSRGNSGNKCWERAKYIK